MNWFFKINYLKEKKKKKPKKNQVNNEQKVASSGCCNSIDTYATILRKSTPNSTEDKRDFTHHQQSLNRIQSVKMTNGIGSLCDRALRNAKTEDRLIVGLTQAIKTLSNDPEETMFCVLAQPKPGDSAAHMQVILLEAFCYENGIYTIKVDDAEKLSNIVDAKKLENCVLMQRFKHNNNHDTITTTTTTTMTTTKQPLKLKFFDLEEKLIDHCEDYWDAQHKPIIRLPDE